MWPDVTADIDTVEEITSMDRLGSLRLEWWDLWNRSRAATPFQSPAWIMAWWKHFGWEGLWVLTLRSEGRLVGLAPLFIWPRPETAERTLLLIGTGITDYLDAVFEDGFEESGAATVLDYVQQQSEQWDVCDFQQLPADSALLTGLPRGRSDEITEQDGCLVLTISDGAHDCSEFLPGRMWKNLRYYRRRAEKAGEVHVEPVSEANFETLFDALLRLHAVRWESGGEEGMFAEGDVRQFHREVAQGMLAYGLLRMYGLYLGDRIVACYYGMTAKGRANYYLSGFDPEFAQLSLGTQIVGHAICEASREGAVAFDFLRGREDYKYAWGATRHPTYRRQLRMLE